MVPFSISYRGQLRCELTHGPSRATVLTDAPVDNHGKGESFSPTDLVTVGLGACMMTTMGIVAQRDGIALDGTTVHVEKHMTTSPPRKIARVVVRFTMARGIPAARRQALERAALGCPVTLSLHPDVVQDVAFTWPD